MAKSLSGHLINVPNRVRAAGITRTSIVDKIFGGTFVFLSLLTIVIFQLSFLAWGVVVVLLLVLLHQKQFSRVYWWLGYQLPVGFWIWYRNDYVFRASELDPTAGLWRMLPEHVRQKLKRRLRADSRTRSQTRFPALLI